MVLSSHDFQRSFLFGRFGGLGKNSGLDVDDWFCCGQEFLPFI